MKKRLKSIDCLRGVAIGLVLFRHHDLFPLLQKVGWIGVDLFFVLSGFLVSGLLFKEYQKFGDIKPLHFLIRRGFKIYPSFYTLFLFVFLTQWMGGQSIQTRQVFGEIFFLQNYLGSLSGHTWSLAVEEHFYFFLSALLWGMIQGQAAKNQGFRWIPWFFLAIASLSLGLRFWVCYQPIPFRLSVHLYPSHLRFDGLFFGVLLAYFYHFEPERLQKFVFRNKSILLLAGLLAISPAFILNLQDFGMLTWGLTALYLGFGCLLIYFVFFVQAEQIPFFLVPLFYGLAWIGYYSYPIYLWHLSVHYYSERLLGIIWEQAPALFHFLVYFVGSIALGAVLSHGIEIPFLRLRNRYFPSRVQ